MNEIGDEILNEVPESKEFFLELNSSSSSKDIINKFSNLKKENINLYNKLKLYFIKSKTYNDLIDAALKKKFSN